MNTAVLSEDELALISRCSAALRLRVSSIVTMLSAGRSGSLVVRLVCDDRAIVLKITTEERRLRRALLEIRLLDRGCDQFGRVQPSLITSGHGPGWVAAAFEQYVPVAGAALLAREEWIAIATTLASIHQPPASPIPELEHRRPPVAADVTESVRRWAGIGAGSDARRGLERLDRLSPAAAYELPVVMVHGDCHTENIVQDDHGGYRWIDWQEVGLGDGLADLVFLWQRAEFAGAAPPREAMLAAYARVRRLDPAALVVVCDRHELRLLVQEWGPFLSFGSAAARAVMKLRLAELASG